MPIVEVMAGAVAILLNSASRSPQDYHFLMAPGSKDIISRRVLLLIKAADTSPRP